MIKVENLTKLYFIYKRRLSAIKHLFGLAVEGKDYEIVRPLHNINLNVPTGSVHGIIGMNGAGKSTLLKILTGVLDQSSGTISVTGRVASLLELGTGFHNELTGRENIYINGSIHGFSKEHIEKKIADIIKFSELGDYFDRPVKTYSSGMYVRLAFAFAISVDPEVLIIDEALSVGDAYFQQKCLKKIREFRDMGTTILFVSHDLSAIKLLCETVTLLSHGENVYTGSPITAMDLYNDIISERKNLEEVKVRANLLKTGEGNSSYSSGNHKISVMSAKLFNDENVETSLIVTGSRITIKVETLVNSETIDNPTCGILIKDLKGYEVFGTNTHQMGLASGQLKKGDRPVFQFVMDLNIGPGMYSLSVALHSFRSHVEDNYHWLERAFLIEVLPAKDYSFSGVVRLKATSNASPM